MHKLFHETAKVQSSLIIPKFFSPGHPLQIKNYLRLPNLGLPKPSSDEKTFALPDISVCACDGERPAEKAGLER